jgi:hypothetical protein
VTLTCVALLGAGTGLVRAAHASVELGQGAQHASLQVDAKGDALITWKQGGNEQSIYVPASGELSHGGALSGPDVSKPVGGALVPGALSIRRTPGGVLYALQELSIGGQPPMLDLSRWRGAPTTLTLTLSGDHLQGRLSFHDEPLSGHSFTLGGLRPRIYVFLDCFDCGGKHGWSEMLGVAPRADGQFSVLLRPNWRGSGYRASVTGPNFGTTYAPDAQTSSTPG